MALILGVRRALAMTCTLDLRTDYLLSSTGQTSGTGLSRLFAGAISHDQVTCVLKTAYRDSKTLWRQAKPLVRRAEQAQKRADYAVLIGDDSVPEKAHSAANAMLCPHWDYSQGRHAKGLNFVPLFYPAGAGALRIAAERIEKTHPCWAEKSQQPKYKSTCTKNAYLRQMLRVAQPRVASRYLLADSWYAAAENRDAVRVLGHHFIFTPEGSRPTARRTGRRDGPVAGPEHVGFSRTATPARVSAPPRGGGARGQAGLCKQRRQSGRGSWSAATQALKQAQLMTIYQRRWKVEE